MSNRTGERHVHVINPLLEEIHLHGCPCPLPTSHPYATSRKTAVPVKSLTEYERSLQAEFRDVGKKGQPARMTVRHFVEDFTPEVETYFAERVPPDEVAWETRNAVSRVVAAGKMAVEDTNILLGIFDPELPDQSNEAKGLFFARHQPNAHRFASHVVGERSDVDPRKAQMLVEDAADETLCNILFGPSLSGQQPLDDFLGNCQFTTWLYTVIRNKVGAKLRLPSVKKELNPDIALTYPVSSDDSELDERTRALNELFDSNPPPWPSDQKIHTNPRGIERQTRLVVFKQELPQIIEEALTDRQRAAFIPIVIGGRDPAAIAEQLGTNRNNVYKIIHDARAKLRQNLAMRGWTEESLGLFD